MLYCVLQALQRFCSSLHEASQYVDLRDITQPVEIQTTKVREEAASAGPSCPVAGCVQACGAAHCAASCASCDWRAHGRFCCPCCVCLQVSFVASTEVQLADGSRMLVMVDQLSRLVQTPVGLGGVLPHFNPFEGASAFLPEVDARDCKLKASSSCLQQEL